MKLKIDPDSSVPIYVQIEDSIHSFIAAGQLKPGEQLPKYGNWLRKFA